MGFISNGTTILDNGAFSVGLGGLVLLSEQTASASASISFTTGIDSTYPVYKFEFINCHPANNNATFTFNMSTDGGSNYNVTKTTTYFWSYHDEGDIETSLGYLASRDLAQSTAYAQLSSSIGNNADEACSGSMTLFNPSSTTYVKHFISTENGYSSAFGGYTINVRTAGYGNTTSAINAVQFKFDSGNIDSGTIKLYGIKDS